MRVKVVVAPVFKLCARYYSRGVSRKTQPNIFCDLRSARTRASSNALEGVCETDTFNVVMGEPAFISSKNPLLRPDSRPASVEALDSPVTNRARLQQAENIFSLHLFLCQFAVPAFQFFTRLDPKDQHRFSFGFYSQTNGPNPIMNDHGVYDHYAYALRSHFGSSLTTTIPSTNLEWVRLDQDGCYRAFSRTGR